jgi:hypothetical protein
VIKPARFRPGHIILIMAEQLSMFNEPESNPVDVYIITFDVGTGKQTIETRPMNEFEFNDFLEFMDVMGIWNTSQKKD